MTRMDKLMILGAWALMASVGVFGIWKANQGPRVAPGILALQSDLERDPNKPRQPAPDPVPHWNPLAYFGPVADARSASTEAGSMPLKLVGKGIPHPTMTVAVLALPVLGEAKADLDGIRIAWTLQTPKVGLRPWMTQAAAKASAFIVKRQCEDGPVEQIAELGPEARSFSDLTALPRRTYRYWVLVRGPETLISSFPATEETVTKGLEASVTAKVPSATRLKLVGGDKATAILKIETYDRTQKKWLARTLTVAPGKEVGSSGWTLKGLRFDNFTLVADVSDDDGVDRVLTTKD